MSDNKITKTDQIKIWNNPYQYTRAIRFRSNLPTQGSECFKNLLSHSEKTFDLQKLSEHLQEIKNKLEEIFYYDYEDKTKDDDTAKKRKLNNQISVKISWLRRYHKDIFYSRIKKDNKTKKWNLHKDLKEIHKNFNDKFNFLKESINYIQFSSESLEKDTSDKSRKSDTAYYIRLLNRDLPYFIHFLDESHSIDAQVDDKINKIKNLYDKEIKTLLEKAKQYYCSNESSGVEIAKASFNYYTVNKESKEYFEKEKELERELNEDQFAVLKKEQNKVSKVFFKISSIKNKNSKEGKKICLFKSDLEKEWINRWIKKTSENSQISSKQRSSFIQWLETECNSDQISISLNQTYDLMKSFKAEQKSIFYELMNHIVSKDNNYYEVKNKNYLLCGYQLSTKIESADDINKCFSLFEFGDNWEQKNKKNGYYNNKYKCNTKEQWFEKFISLTKIISCFNKDKNSKEKIQEIKKERGNFLFGKYGYYFKKYGEFCEQYKCFAQKRGKLKAQIKGLEEEKIEATQVKYWSIIYAENDHKKLWLIPKGKIKEARKFIYNTHGRKKYSSGDEQYVCCFESLTMRALHKLCFSQESSFVKEMPNNLKKLQESANNFKTEQNEQKIKEKNDKKLKFFKELVKSDYFVKNQGSGEYKDKGLYLENFNLSKIEDVQSLEEFEKEIEKSCYDIKKISISNDEKEYFLKEYNVTILDITSYDIEGRNKRHTPSSTNRLHTNLWESFWKSVEDPNQNQTIRELNLGMVRINPEVKIYYREASNDLKKYFIKKNFPEKFKHRRLQDQLTVAFTLSLNAGKKYEQLAFMKPEEMGEKIDDFNNKLNQSLNFKSSWKYGIDRGQAELATLCISRLSEGDNISKLGKFECYTLKDYNSSKKCTIKNKETKTRKAIDNLSDFIDEDDLFQKTKTSCLDLTTAKVIKEKIVTNGDVKTYLKLKKESAKRHLYNLYSQSMIQKGTILKWSEHEGGDQKKLKPDGVLNIRTSNNKENTIYYYRKEYKEILSKEEIQNNFHSYLKKLLDSKHSRHTPSIEKINHLRDAITANMVGVICHLQKKYKGFIILEDLEKSMTESHCNTNNENISRRLEYALCNKFQSLGLVPPHTKNLIQLREDLRQNISKQNKKNKTTNTPKEDKIENNSSQIGAIVFVPKEKTSQICPACEKSLQQSKEEKDHQKFVQKRFICRHCNFDTYLFKSEKDRLKDYEPKVNMDHLEKFKHLKDIDDPDKVASYNIAIKIKNQDQIGQWKDMVRVDIKKPKDKK